MSQIEAIRAFLIKAVSEEKRDIIAAATAQFQTTRQTVHRHLKALVDLGTLSAAGKTKGRVYSLRTLADRCVASPISERPPEDRAWLENFADAVAALPENIAAICNYGFTEMFNNAVDHSEGTTVTARLRLTAASVEILMHDDGVGIFNKVRQGFHLADEREAILELAKGKVTTDPAHHSGEGIFFTSRMFDEFSLLSGGLFFRHWAPDDDWLIETGRDEVRGTLVTMKIASSSTRTARAVFDEYTSDRDVPTFDKTHVPVSLLRVGAENLVSRSQARRLLARFNRFREVMLDFEGVSEIGQAFSDEIFRVFKNDHPEITIRWIRANQDVERMILRALNPM